MSRTVTIRYESHALGALTIEVAVSKVFRNQTDTHPPEQGEYRIKSVTTRGQERPDLIPVLDGRDHYANVTMLTWRVCGVPGF